MRLRLRFETCGNRRPAVDGLRGQNGEDLALEAPGNRLSLLVTQRGIGNDFDSFGGKPREESSVITAACRSSAFCVFARTDAICSTGVRPSGPGMPMPVSTLRLIPATRIMKNSSRFVAKIAANLTRSRSGFVHSSASKRTRLLKSSQLNSRLMNISGSRGGKSAIPLSAAASPSLAPMSVPVPVPGYNAAPAGPFYLRLRHLDASIRHASRERGLVDQFACPDDARPDEPAAAFRDSQCIEAKLAQVHFTAQCTRWLTMASRRE